MTPCQLVTWILAVLSALAGSATLIAVLLDAQATAAVMAIIGIVIACLTALQHSACVASSSPPPI